MSVSKIMLNALGKQDSFLIENPEFTYFKKKPSTHTNFAKSLVEIDPNRLQNDETSINFGETIDFTIDNTGDLLLNLTTKFVLEDPRGDKWNNLNNTIVPETLFALIDYIEIVSNDRILQKLTGIWMYIYYTNYKSNSDNQHLINSASASKLTRTDLIDSNLKEYTLHLPIPFWFSKNSDLALPLCSLQHEKISVNLKLKNFNEISSNMSIQSDFIIKNIKLMCEFIELEQYEQQKFLQTPLEYLIEQVEYNGPYNINVKGNTSLRMKFELQDSYLVKDIIWVFKEKNPNQIKNYFNFWHNNESGEYRTDHFKNGSILLNGRVLNPRFSASYYRIIQRDQYYKSNRVYITSNSGTNNYLDKDLEKKNNCIYSYSFSLDPELIKSSGFLSFKKFNNVHLDLQLSSLSNTKDRELLIFIKRFNIIRIKNGNLNILAN
jgi:hypothetical protein